MLSLLANDTVSTSASVFDNLTIKCPPPLTDRNAERIGQITACSLLFVLALTGNSFVVFLVYKTHEMRRNINILIANMALSDALVIISGLSINLHDLILGRQTWEFRGLLGNITCKLATFLPNTAHLVSLMTLLLISIERYRVVINPTGALPITPRLRKVLLFASWALPSALSAFYLVYVHIRVFPNNQVICGIDFAIPAVPRYAVFILTLSVVLLLILLVLNLSILRRLRQARVANSLSASQRRSREKRVKNAVAMVLCSVLFYVVLWTPQRLAYMLIIGNYATMFSDPCSEVARALGFVLNFFVYLNPACSPLIYFTFLQDFRKGLKRTFGCQSRDNENSNTQEATQMPDRN